jgi:putative transposon-encoded protein
LRDKGCTIYYEKSVTKNLGNYESAKVTVGVTLPINPTKDELEAIQSTIEVADDLITEELEVQLKELVTKK